MGDLGHRQLPIGDQGLGDLELRFVEGPGGALHTGRAREPPSARPHKPIFSAPIRIAP